MVNENDTVATAEIRFGDNDRFAARVAAMIGADMLVLLSDVDGLYTANPNGDGGNPPPRSRRSPQIFWRWLAQRTRLLRLEGWLPNWKPHGLPHLLVAK